MAIATIPIAFSSFAGAQALQENRFPQKESPQGFQTYRYSGAYFNDKAIYTLRQTKLCKAPGKISGIAVNPTGATVTAIWNRGKGGNITVYDFWRNQAPVSNPRLNFSVVSICYSKDARTMALCDDDGYVHLLNAKTMTQYRVLNIGFPATKLEISGNNNFIAAGDNKKVNIYVLSDGSLRKSISYEARVNDFTFSPDNSFISILTSDGFIIEYDTAGFMPGNEIGALNEAVSFSMHNNCKYYVVVTSMNALAIVNRLNPEDRQYILEEENGVANPQFVDDDQGWIGYSTENSLVYKRILAIQSNFGKLIKEEIALRMKEWSRRMPTESLEEYNLRVNEETRKKQIVFFEEEIATRLASGKLESSKVSLGSYNQQDGILSLNFDTMPSIFLSVSSDKLGNFSDLSELEFRNARYGVKGDDTFELVYVEVFNKRSGESFVFDNRERKSLEYLKLNDSFVPLDIVQLANMEEARLQDIKESVMTESLQNKTITNHTKIDIATGVEKSVDAFGKSILNYRVTFSYDVQPGFSDMEDFRPGAYKVEDSGAALAMVSIISQVLNADLSRYLKEGASGKMILKGMADNLKIHGNIAYDGSFGDFVDEPVFRSGKDLHAVTVTKAGGITDNEQLALLRAASVGNHIVKSVPTLSQMDLGREFHVELSDSEGGAYRRISVEFVFNDAF